MGLLLEREGSVRLKQIRLSPSTGLHDLEIKMKQAKGFLRDVHRVNVYIQFKRGKGRLKEDAKASLTKVAGDLGAWGTLSGVKCAGEVVELLKDPPIYPDAIPDAPCPQRCSRLSLTLLPKRIREKISRETLQKGNI